MGDAILKVGDVDVTSIDAFKDAVTKAFGAEKGALLLVERPITVDAVKLVKLALMAEKVPNPNPPIPKDVWAIASFQLAWMKAHPGEEPAFSLLKEDQPDLGSPGPSGVRQATLAPKSQEFAIGTDTDNPRLLQDVPASPSAHQITNSAHHVKHAKK
ncbi:hypothetical protein AAVH_07452 [Aphelenchoides avenae]|nr:hypothetical protein AAVH_07452 [Aphelenchus avenae]